MRAEELANQVKKGYYSANATGTSYNDANAAFVNGTYPMDLTGSWMFGSFLTSITNFQWGIFVMPGKTLNTGSGGNLWVVPAGAQNKDLAYDFIDLTMQKKAQTIMANEAASRSMPISPRSRTHISENSTRPSAPSWPTMAWPSTPTGPLPATWNPGRKPPGVDRRKSYPHAFLDAIAGPWKEYKATIP